MYVYLNVSGNFSSQHFIHMNIQSIRPLICFILLSLLLLTTNCNSSKSEYSKLENYYNKNEVLHTNLSDSLIAFCKTNKTEVKLRKSHIEQSMITFNILFGRESTFYAIYYDSALQRHDANPQKTSKYRIPIDIIKGFNETIYIAIGADSSQTFFADKWDVKFQLGTQGDSQYGILISSDTGISTKCEKRLSANVCLTRSAVH